MVIENGRGCGAKQRVVQVGIERGQFLVGWLLGEVGIRPKPLERPEFWLFHGTQLYCRMTR